MRSCGHISPVGFWGRISGSRLRCRRIYGSAASVSDYALRANPTYSGHRATDHTLELRALLSDYGCA